MYPKVSIIWLNYNSIHIFDIIKQSLYSLLDLDYPNYEIIIIDNHSTDGSYKMIKEYILKSRENTPIKIYRTTRNLGFTGGNNIGFRLRSCDSKYVLLVNNDAILEKDALTKLVEYMERDPSIGACQGVILKTNKREIDTAGDFLDELMFSHMYLNKSSNLPSRPFYITYSDGAISLIRVKSALIANKSNKLFDEYLFAYLDDNLLGLKLWNSGYKVISVPIIAGYHYRGGIFKKIHMKRLELSLASSFLLAKLTNSRYKKIIPYIHIKRLIDHIFRFKKNPLKTFTAFLKAYCYAFKTSPYIKLNLYKAPIIRVTFNDILIFLTSRREYTKKLMEKIKI